MDKSDDHDEIYSYTQGGHPVMLFGLINQVSIVIWYITYVHMYHKHPQIIVNLVMFTNLVTVNGGPTVSPTIGNGCDKHS